MNPAMILIIPLGLALIWLCSSSVYKLIGKMFLSIYDDAVDAMSVNEEKETNKNV